MKSGRVWYAMSSRFRRKARFSVPVSWMKAHAYSSVLEGLRFSLIEQHHRLIEDCAYKIPCILVEIVAFWENWLRGASHIRQRFDLVNNERLKFCTSPQNVNVV